MGSTISFTFRRPILQVSSQLSSLLRPTLQAPGSRLQYEHCSVGVPMCIYNSPGLGTLPRSACSSWWLAATNYPAWMGPRGPGAFKYSNFVSPVKHRGRLNIYTRIHRGDDARGAEMHESTLRAFWGCFITPRRIV